MHNLPIGILGGAFDPIHLGHLRAGLEVSEKFRLGTVYFVPCQTPVHKLPTVANVTHRLHMLTLAIADEPKFQVDECEIQRITASYMVETLTTFRETWGQQRPLALIVGLDAFAKLDTWHRWESLSDLAHIIVLSREDKKPSFSAALEKTLRDRKSDSVEVLSQTPSGSIFFHNMTQLNISSTAVRAMIKRHQSPRYLVPEAVLAYIEKYELYTAGQP
jgi:nicotinate-nucleotide adenylyltransferase